MNFEKMHVLLLVVIGVLLAPTNFASAQIVAFGSSTVGGAVAENEMWPAVFEDILRAKGSQVHIANAGRRWRRLHALPAPSLKKKSLS